MARDKSSEDVPQGEDVPPAPEPVVSNHVLAEKLLAGNASKDEQAEAGRRLSAMLT